MATPRALLALSMKGGVGKTTTAIGLSQALQRQFQGPATFSTTPATRLQSLIQSADNSRILTGSSDGTAGVWDAESGNELVRISSPPEQLRLGHSFQLRHDCYQSICGQLWSELHRQFRHLILELRRGCI